MSGEEIIVDAGSPPEGRCNEEQPVIPWLMSLSFDDRSSEEKDVHTVQLFVIV